MNEMQVTFTVSDSTINNFEEFVIDYTNSKASIVADNLPIVFHSTIQEAETVVKLLEQIDKMKCCSNCKYYKQNKDDKNFNVCTYYDYHIDDSRHCKHNINFQYVSTDDLWELKE